MRREPLPYDGDEEFRHDLFWHALNYRTAGISEAEKMWKELEACVERLIVLHGGKLEDGK